MTPMSSVEATGFATDFTKTDYAMITFDPEKSTLELYVDLMVYIYIYLCGVCFSYESLMLQLRYPKRCNTHR